MRSERRSRRKGGARCSGSRFPSGEGGGPIRAGQRGGRRGRPGDSGIVLAGGGEDGAALATQHAHYHKKSQGQEALVLQLLVMNRSETPLAYFGGYMVLIVAIGVRERDFPVEEFLSDSPKNIDRSRSVEIVIGFQLRCWCLAGPL